MNPYKSLRTIRNSIFLSALLGMTAIVPANALTMPVIDFSVLGQTSQQVTQLGAQLQELSTMKDALTGQLEAIGGAGILSDVLGGSDFAQSGSGSDFFSNATALGYDPCAVTLCLIEGNDNVGYTDITEASDWVERSLFTSGVLSSEQRRDLQEVRRRAVRYSGINGLAMANILHTDLVRSGKAAEGLESIIDASTTVRGDIQANSAVGLATYKVEVQQLAALTSLLGVASSVAIEEMPLNLSEKTMGGGAAVGQTPSNIPDVYKEGDFDRNNSSIRNRVTPLEPRYTPGQAKSSPANAKSGAALARVASNLGISQADAITQVLGGGNSGGSGNGFDLLVNAGGNASGSGGLLTQDALINASVGAINERVGGSNIPGLDLLTGNIGSTSNQGVSGALYGAGGILASLTGRGDIGEFIEDAGQAITSGSDSTILDFALNQASIFAGNGNSEMAQLLQRLVGQVKNGGLSTQGLLATATNEYLRSEGLTGTGIESLISADPNQLSKTDLQNLVGNLTQSIGQRTGDQSLIQAGGLVRSYTPERIDQFNASGSSNGGTYSPDTQNGLNMTPTVEHPALQQQSSSSILSEFGTKW